MNTGSQWTLVHGDFHAGNQLFDRKTGEITTLDWEVVGLGSGPQELGQYVISHVEPDLRRAHEKEYLRIYYDEVVTRGVNDFTWEQCYDEYRFGGVGRWIWFMAWFGAQEGMPTQMV